MYLVTAQEMQAMDRQAIEAYGIPGVVLMENAGRGATDMFLKVFPDHALKTVCVLCGRGNNGGDGFVMARYLIQKGIRTRVFLLSQAGKIQGDAKINLTILERIMAGTGQGELVELPDESTFQAWKDSICNHDLFIDGILGTGLNADVRGFFKAVIETVNGTGKPVFSIDIPSGLNADTGQPWGTCIRATATATFAFAKPGHMVFPGSELTGRLEVIDIGIPGCIADAARPLIHLYSDLPVRSMLRPRSADGHKGRFGHLLVLAGSTGKTGAAALVCKGAMASGTGLVTLGIPRSLNPVMEPQVTETMTFPLPETATGCLAESGFADIQKLSLNKSAMALGPGLGTESSTQTLVKKLMAQLPIPMVVDADGLNCIAGNPHVLESRKGPTILTPHPGEMARLCSTDTETIQKNRLFWARDFATRYRVTLVLKGYRTLTALPDGRIVICPAGNPGMASGGMGDVLTGIIAGLLAQGHSPEESAAAGVFVHALCGDALAKRRGNFGFVASNIIDILPETFQEILA
ncbi:MAG: NAD(P)H-hydrate dehydratase [Pseudomonadota bacterium]